MENDKTVLIIDDDRDFQTVLSSILRKKGFNVLSLFDGPIQNCIKNNELPDVILLDFNLPHSNGVDIGKELRASAATKDIPIIMLSAADDIEKLYAAAGANEYVTKPFVITDLLKKILKYFKKGNMLRINNNLA